MNNYFVEKVTSYFDELKKLFAEKHKQYGDIDPLANFRTGAMMAEGAEIGYAEMYEEAKAYQRKHIAHVQNHGINGPKIDESLRDIAVYSLIMLYMLEELNKDKLRR